MKKFFIMLIVIAVMIFGGKFYFDRSAAKQVEVPLNRANKFASVHYEKATMKLMGFHPQLNNVTISPHGSGTATKIDRVIVYELDETHEIPFRLDIEFQQADIEVNEENFGAQADDLRQMGYEKSIRANVRVSYIYDIEKKEFQLRTFRVGAERVGHINAAFHLSNIDLNPQMLFMLLLTYPNIRFHSAELSYEDDSFLPRLQKFRAEQEGKTVEDVVKEMTDELDKEIAKEENKFNKDALKALKKFVKDPDEIKITVSPKEPIPLGQLQGMDPVKAPEMLNVKIKS